MAEVAAGSFAQGVPDRPLRVIGSFSNIRFTEEHAYGYDVELWRDGDSVIGLISAADGLQGDTPTGILENVRFDSRTGGLSFTAKLTCTRRQIGPDGNWLSPSHDLFQFSGTLKPRVLVGTLTRSDLSQPLPCATPRCIPETRERVELRMRPIIDSFSTGSYAEWRRQVDEVLKRLGPKW